MQGKTHAVIGTLAGVATTLPVTDDLAAIAVGAALGGLTGLVPDWLQVNIPGASRQLKGALLSAGIHQTDKTKIEISVILLSFIFMRLYL